MEKGYLTSTVANNDGLFDLQRRVISHKVSESWKNVPHVTYLYEPDITDFLDKFQDLQSRKKETEIIITFNTLILYAITAGLMAAPDLNASIEYHSQKSSGSLTAREEINITIPWLLEDGRMITPVLCGAQDMTLSELGAGIADLQMRINHTNIDELLFSAAVADTKDELKKFHLGVLRRVFSAMLDHRGYHGLSGSAKSEYYHIPEEKRLTGENLLSGTVTVSNIGSLYKNQKGGFGLIEVIPPQIFAVGLGAVQEKPGIFHIKGGKEIGIRKFLPICLEFDHRAIDFNSLIPFLKRLDEIFQNPAEILDW